LRERDMLMWGVIEKEKWNGGERERCEGTILDWFK
jgi:hypothetical protein